MFDDFVLWASETGYEKYASLRRVRADKPYGPDNAVWDFPETVKQGYPKGHPCKGCELEPVCVNPGVYWGLNEAGNIKFNKNYAQLGVMVGYTYHFKTSNGTHYFKTYDVGAMTDEISRLNEELAKKSKEVEVIIVEIKFVLFN